MKRLFTLALAAGMTVWGAGAQSAAVKFKPGHLPPVNPMYQRAAAKALTGTWLAVYDGGFHNSVMQWRKDGTASQNTDFSTLSGNVIMGDWVAVDGKTASVYMVAWNYDDSGNLSGWFVKKETDKVKRDGYTGSYEVTFYDLEGNVLLDHSGTLSATRVAAE